MSKVTDFYAKAMADSDAKAKLEAVIGGKDLSTLTDAELAKVGEIAKGLGYDITVAEAKAYIETAEEATDEDLDAVAGGAGKKCGKKGGGIKGEDFDHWYGETKDGWVQVNHPNPTDKDLYKPYTDV